MTSRFAILCMGCHTAAFKKYAAALGRRVELLLI
jgi:hypothetical protein